MIIIETFPRGCDRSSAAYLKGVKYEEIKNHLRRFHEDRKTRLGHYKASPQGADFYEEVLYRCREELNALRGS